MVSGLSAIQFGFTQRHLMLSLVFIAYWSAQIGTAAPLSSMENELPNSSQLFLGGLTRRRCPSVSEKPDVVINENATGLLPMRRGSRSACRYVAQCDVTATPPEVQVSWYAVEADGQEILLHSDVQRDITVDFLAEQPFPDNQEQIVGVSQTLNRFCLDPYMSTPHHTYRFKCRAESVCNSNKDQSEIIVVRPKASFFKTNHAAPRRQAPIITTITSTRLETNGPLVQLFCHASGSPKPQIEWSIMDEMNDIAYPIADQSFIKVLETNDLIIDTKEVKSSIASLSFVCNATNALGHSSETSTLVLLSK